MLRTLSYDLFKLEVEQIGYESGINPNYEKIRRCTVVVGLAYWRRLCANPPPWCQRDRNDHPGCCINIFD